MMVTYITSLDNANCGKGATWHVCWIWLENRHLTCVVDVEWFPFWLGRLVRLIRCSVDGHLLMINAPHHQHNRLRKEVFILLPCVRDREQSARICTSGCLPNL